MRPALKKTKKYMPVVGPVTIPWLTEQMVMSHFQICKRTLWVWHQKGLLKYQVGKLTLYKAEDLNALIEKHLIVPRKKKAVNKNIR